MGSITFIITNKTMGWVAFVMSLEEKSIKFMIPRRMIKEIGDNKVQKIKEQLWELGNRAVEQCLLHPFSVA